MRRPYDLILASASPRRRELLRRWGISARIIPSAVAEDTILRRPHAIVRSLALRKARAVARGLSRGIVLGADTIVVLKGRILGKPGTRSSSARMLSALSGTWHRVYTGVALIDARTGRELVVHDVSRVKMRSLSLSERARYAGRHMDKAGSYAVQEHNDSVVERIDGDYFTVVGLPLRVLRPALAAFGIPLRQRRDTTGRKHG